MKRCPKCGATITWSGGSPEFYSDMEWPTCDDGCGWVGDPGMDRPDDDDEFDYQAADDAMPGIVG